VKALQPAGATGLRAIAAALNERISTTSFSFSTSSTRPPTARPANTASPDFKASASASKAASCSWPRSRSERPVQPISNPGLGSFQIAIARYLAVSYRAIRFPGNRTSRARNSRLASVVSKYAGVWSYGKGTRIRFPKSPSEPSFGAPPSLLTADSDDLAQVYRFDLAQDSEMISPTVAILMSPGARGVLAVCFLASAKPRGQS
jgi:hypothetical protein